MKKETASLLISPIKAAVVGLGRAGWGMHLGAMLKQGDYQIQAIADMDAGRRREAQEKTGCAQYENIDALLAQTDCDLVAIATPSGLHYSEAKKVLLSGRHCVLEKPMVLHFEEGEELVALAKEKNLLLAVNHSMAFTSDFHHLREIVASGILGRIFHLRMMYAKYMRRWDWQTLKKNGGGLLNNWGTHVLSVSLPILNSRVSSVSAHLQHVKDRGDVEDHVDILLKTESGATADLLITSSCAFPGTKWMLLGERGTLVSDGKTTQMKYYDPEKFPLPELDESMAAAGRKYNVEELPWEEKTLPSKPSFPIPSFYQNVVDALTGKSELIVRPEDALEVVRTIDLVKRSVV